MSAISSPTMIWWAWVLLALFLLGIELATPTGFFLFFCGVGALLTAILSGVVSQTPAWFQWIFFSVTSVALILLLRRRLAGTLYRPESSRGEEMLGQFATATEQIESGEVGKVELQGSSWSARNVGTAPILKGGRCVVRSVEGLMVLVAQEE